ATLKTEEATREAEELKLTLGFIQKFDIFPINDFCPAKRCKPCLHDWILFQKKCYLFYDEPAPWKTWEQSRRFCQDRRADLVVINDLEEQEFVSKHVKSYFDIQWGYWLGLQQTNNTWTWVDGRVDTLGFWMKEELKTPGPKARLMPGRNPSESWNKADSFFQNKFICEHEAFPSVYELSPNEPVWFAQPGRDVVFLQLLRNQTVSPLFRFPYLWYKTNLWTLTDRANSESDLFMSFSSCGSHIMSTALNKPD
ncbi:PREDICTED: C-type lectin domain family 4 member M-like, partial [Poecilia mexicana]|uniref:C-type lectin domain family 4 member M-like n=1 Tax=Poecilia mexicana TaxID=48701 RepID=UPI00072E4C85